MTVLGRTLRAGAERFGDRIFLAPEGGEPWTYRQVDRASDEVAAGLAARGVGDRSVVGLLLESTPEWIVAVVAASKLGALYSGVNPRLAPAEQQRVLDRLAADVVLQPGEAFGLQAPGADPVAIPPADPERPCVVVFTSGTTGEPKGAEFRERNIEAIVQIDLGPEGARSWGGGGPILVSTQFAHIGVSTKLAWYARTGARLHLLARWRPADALRVTARERIPSVGGISAHIGLMLRQPDFDAHDLDCVKTIVIGGGPSPAVLVEEARRRFGAAYSNRYSSTECGGCGTGTAFDADDDEALHTVGRGRGGVEVAIGEGGEILLRSGAVMAGYWRDPERTAVALDGGWLHTGDLGELDERGLLHITGRADDMYIRGGYNVHPGEVEAVLLAHPAVAQVAVVARPDGVLGQIGVAVVVPAGDPPSLDDLRRFGRARLADYKLPEALVVRDHLPLTTMDKLDRRLLETEVGGLATVRAAVPVDLAALLDPRRCAVVTQECQVGVIGEQAVLRELADAARAVALPNLVRLVVAARAHDVPVVHCLAVRRADDKGSNRNARLFTATRKLGIRLEPGSPGAALLPELGPEPSDVVLQRFHGVGPMGGTDLDAVLRNLGVRTIVGIGVSVNIAIPNFVMDAVNAGYDFVLARDAVAGVPQEYADAVIDNTLSLLATVTTTDDVIAAWS